MMERISVIKVGGAVVEDTDALSRFLDRFVAFEGLKLLVHGGGREATRVAGLLGLETRMVAGRRITDAPMLDVVTMVYAGKVNKNIVAGLQNRGVKALGLCGADMNCITSKKRAAGDVDYGYVGDIEKVDTNMLSLLLSRDIVPVMVPITSDGKGQLLNTNADSVASAVASALSESYEVTLVSCFEKKGVLANPEDEESVIPLIDGENYRSLLEKGVVGGGMIPKLDNAFDALRKGVAKVVITNSDTLGEGSGTTVVL